MEIAQLFLVFKNNLFLSVILNVTDETQPRRLIFFLLCTDMVEWKTELRMEQKAASEQDVTLSEGKLVPFVHCTL